MSMYQTKKHEVYCSRIRRENISEAISCLCHKNALERITLDKEN